MTNLTKFNKKKKEKENEDDDVYKFFWKKNGN